MPCRRSVHAVQHPALALAASVPRAVADLAFLLHPSPVPSSAQPCLASTSCHNRRRLRVDGA